MSKEVASISFETPIKKIIKEEYPNISNISKNLLNCLSDCTKEFATILISGTAEACDAHGTLVVPDDIKKSLEKLGYPQYIPAVEKESAEIKKLKQARPKPKPNELSLEEMIELQKRNYREAKEELKRRENLGY